MGKRSEGHEMGKVFCEKQMCYETRSPLVKLFSGVTICSTSAADAGYHGFLITVSLQVLNGAILQQVFVVEFVVQNQMCDDCHRVEAKDFWKAVVQVRQKVRKLA